MSTLVTVIVREDRPDFHGVLANVTVEGSGDPAQFDVVMRMAMRQSRLSLPGTARLLRRNVLNTEERWADSRDVPELSTALR